VRYLLETGIAFNLYQGDLIRPFATFGSFTEYQIVVHTLCTMLFVSRSQLMRGEARAVVGLFLLLICQDVILTDRTPILMSVIILSSSLIGPPLVRGVLIGSRSVLVALACLAAFVTVPVLVAPSLVQSSNAGVRRLGESIWFWRAETVKDREQHEWAFARQTIRWYPEGLGPREVVLDYNRKAQRPHNNFYILQIAYSSVFPAVFLGAIVLAFWRVFAASGSVAPDRSRVGFCAVGILLAYVAASFFNAPFTGYSGVAFFVGMLWLDQHLQLKPTLRLR
jgi:hypothetical protein